MTTIRIKLHTQRVNARGESQFMITVSNRAREAYISTGIYIKPEFWDRQKEKVTLKCKNAIKYNRLLQSLLDKAMDAWLEMSTENVNASQLAASEIKKYVEKAIYDREKKVCPTFRDVVEAMKKERSKATAGRLSSLSLQVESFETGASDKKIKEINKTWVEQFAAFLQDRLHGVSPFGYFSTFRSVMLYAVDKGLIDKSPATGVSVRKVQTRHRVVGIDYIKRILVNEEGLWEYDILALTFLLIGINFADLHELTEESIVNGRVEYNRKKTKRLYSILLQPEAVRIIDKYRDSGRKKGFGVMEGGIRHDYDKLQRCLAAHGDCITTYYMRHTWATIAAELDIPKETIAAALGHAAGSVTDTYISFNTRKVDEANRRVIDYVMSDGGK